MLILSLLLTSSQPGYLRNLSATTYEGSQPRLKVVGRSSCQPCQTQKDLAGSGWGLWSQVAVAHSGGSRGGLEMSLGAGQHFPWTVSPLSSNSWGNLQLKPSCALGEGGRAPPQTLAALPPWWEQAPWDTHSPAAFQLSGAWGTH